MVVIRHWYSNVTIKFTYGYSTGYVEEHIIL